MHIIVVAFSFPLISPSLQVRIKGFPLDYFSIQCHVKFDCNKVNKNERATLTMLCKLKNLIDYEKVQRLNRLQLKLEHEKLCILAKR